MNPEIYVHRVGRTGRAGETGVAISLVGSDERFHFSKIRAGFPVKELKGKVDKGPRAPQADRASERQADRPFERQSKGKPSAERPASGFTGPAKFAKSTPAPVRKGRPVLDLDLPPGWVLDDEPNEPFTKPKGKAAKSPAKSSAEKPTKKDGRPPRALPKKGPALDWNEDRPDSTRRGRKPQPPRK